MRCRRVAVATAIVTLLLFRASVNAAAIEPHRLEHRTAHVAIGSSLEVLEDPDGTLTLDDAVAAAERGLFRAVDDGEPNYGFSSSVFWFHFALDNVDSPETEWLLEIAYPLLDDVRIYTQAPDGQILQRRVGDSLPFASREVGHRNFVLAIATRPGARQDVYLRVETESSVQVPLHLWTRVAFADASYQGQLWLGLFYGIGLVMVAYNLLLFLAIRARSYLYFCGVALSYILVQAGLDGLTFQYLWPASPNINSTSLPVSVTLCCGMTFAFTREFLRVRTHMPRWNRAMELGMAVSAILVLVALVAPYHTSIRAVAAYAGISAIGAAVVGFVSWRRGYRAARFFVIAWTVFLFFSLILVLGKFGLIGLGLVTVHGPQIGFVACVVLLTLALTDRLNIATAERDRAQREALEIERRATSTLEAEVDAQTQALRIKADELREANSQRTRFFQNVSHELRTPVTLILAALDQLNRRSELADDSQLALASRNAQRLLRLVNQLLEFQKLSAGKRELRLVPIDLGDFLGHCREYVAAGAAEREIELQLRKPEGAPVIAMAEADALEKIIFNYLSNALKYTPDGGTIALELTHDPAAGSARISVVDNGAGIAKDAQGRLFQVFSQLENGEHARSEGTGLGLALVKELTEAMGGGVGVDSEPGRGSCFWAELPTAPDAEASEGVSATRGRARRARITAHSFASQRAGTSAEPSGPDDGELILVVDDLPDMRSLIRGILERHGYRTIGATSGTDAMQQVRAHRPRAIVSDWMMPGMTGPQLVGELRKDSELASTPVALLTAKSDADSRAQGTEAGADAFLGKPFSERELISVIRNLLRLKAREREIEELNRDLRSERDALARAQEKNQELSRFIVHDLKNPLTIVAVNLELLLDDGALPDDAQASLSDALRATETMTRMVLDLLDVSRGQDSGLPLRKMDVSVPAMFSQIETQMGRWLTNTNHSLQISADVDDICADRDLLVRVLTNLIDNAAKYSPPGGEIQLEATRLDGDTMLRVSDRGPSIPAESRERIFEKYHRLEDSDSASRTSRGLGLVFCRMVAEAHGGSLWVEANEPTGNRFCLRLPG